MSNCPICQCPTCSCDIIPVLPPTPGAGCEEIRNCENQRLLLSTGLFTLTSGDGVTPLSTATLLAGPGLTITATGVNQSTISLPSGLDGDVLTLVAGIPTFAPIPTTTPAIDIAEEGTNIANTPHSRLDFVGAGVTASDGGAGTATITIPGGGSTPAPQVDDFAVDGTWTKPAGATFVKLILIGGGGAGGSGRRGANGTVRGGGGGGSPGDYLIVTVPASMLGATEAVTIGTGGTGGASVTTDDTNGNAGTSGTNTTFGTLFTATHGNGGGGGTLGSGGSGGLVTTTGGRGFLENTIPFVASSGTQGNNGSVGLADNMLDLTLFGLAMGAGGGGISAANIARNGGSITVSARIGIVTGAIGGVVDTTLPIAGTTNADLLTSGGTGGGAASITTNAQNGNSSTLYGGGGAGGGASTNGVGNSGAGGDGAPGFARIITYFA